MNARWLAVGLLVMAAGLLAGCPTVAPPLAPAAPTPAAADVEMTILQAAWDYVHARYPLQPWPDDIYILAGSAASVRGSEMRTSHVVLCSSATGFLWEGDVLWRTGCDGACVVVEGLRERYVAIAASVRAADE